MEQLAIEQEADLKEDLNEKECISKFKAAWTCGRTGIGHRWLIMAKLKTSASEHVTDIVCGDCFYHANLQQMILHAKK